MKNQWNQFPFVLRRKILLTFLAGLASIALSLIFFIITTDHILLVLGSMIFLPLWYWLEAYGAPLPGASMKS